MGSSARILYQAETGLAFSTLGALVVVVGLGKGNLWFFPVSGAGMLFIGWCGVMLAFRREAMRAGTLLEEILSDQSGLSEGS